MSADDGWGDSAKMATLARWTSVRIGSRRARSPPVLRRSGPHRRRRRDAAPRPDAPRHSSQIRRPNDGGSPAQRQKPKNVRRRPQGLAARALRGPRAARLRPLSARARTFSRPLLPGPLLQGRRGSLFRPGAPVIHHRYMGIPAPHGTEHVTRALAGTGGDAAHPVAAPVLELHLAGTATPPEFRGHIHLTSSRAVGPAAWH